MVKIFFPLQNFIRFKIYKIIFFKRYLYLKIFTTKYCSKYLLKHLIIYLYKINNLKIKLLYKKKFKVFVIKIFY